MSFSKEGLAKHRQALRAKGICTACHKRPMDGGKLCAPCKEARNKRRLELKARGLCKCCMTPLDDPAVYVCVNCQVIATELQFWRRQRERGY